MSVGGAQGFNLMVKFFCKRVTEIHGIERFSAYCTANQIHGRDLVPITFKKMLKFNRLLGTDSPALAASRTAGHAVKKLSLFTLIKVVQGACRAILNTGKTPITIVIYSKKRHASLSEECPSKPGSGSPFLPYSAEPPSGFAKSGVLELVCIHIIYGLWLTSTHTFRVTATEVALEGLGPTFVKGHGAGRACRDTQLTSNAEILVDHDPIESFILVNRLFRTYCHAGGVFTVLAGYWQKKITLPCFQDMDAGILTGLQTRMFPGTGDLALFTTVAFCRIRNEDFCIHKVPFCK